MRRPRLLAIFVVLSALALGATIGLMSGPTRAQAPATATVTTVLQPGFNLVGWTQAAAPIDEVFAALGDRASALFAWDAAGERFLSARRSGPAFLNDLTGVVPGQGLWAFIDGATALFWTHPVLTPAPAVMLAAGLNLVAWLGPEAFPAPDAFADVPGLTSVHAFDATRGQFSVYRPSGLALLNDLAEVQTGAGLWVDVSRATEWTQAAFERLPNTVAAVVGADGGEIASEDGNLTLEIPAGALGQDLAITVRRLTGDDLPDPPARRGWVGPVYELGPDGAQFAEDVTLTLILAADEPAVAAGGASDLFIPWLIGTDGRRTILSPIELIVQPDGSVVVRAGVSHFTMAGATFGIPTMGPEPEPMGFVFEVSKTVVVEGEEFVSDLVYDHWDEVTFRTAEELGLQFPSTIVADIGEQFRSLTASYSADGAVIENVGDTVVRPTVGDVGTREGPPRENITMLPEGVMFPPRPSIESLRRAMDTHTYRCLSKGTGSVSVRTTIQLHRDLRIVGDAGQFDEEGEPLRGAIRAAFLEALAEELGEIEIIKTARRAIECVEPESDEGMDGEGEPESAFGITPGSGGMLAANYTLIPPNPHGCCLGDGTLPGMFGYSVEDGSVTAGLRAQQGAASLQIRFTGAAPWVEVVGPIDAEGNFTAEGRGVVAGFSNILVRLEGTLTAEGLSGTYTFGAGGGLPGGGTTRLQVEAAHAP